MKALLILVLFMINIYADPYIEAHVQAIENDQEHVIEDEQIYSRETLLTVYAAYDSNTIWKNEHLDDLIAYLSLADEHGLNSDDYHVDTIKALLSLEVDEDKADELAAKIDLLATDGFITFLDHIKNGKINPKRLNRDWNIKNNYELSAHVVELFDHLTKTSDLRLTIARIEPQHFIYQNTKLALAKYKSVLENGGWQPVEIDTTLKPGMSNASIPQLRHRLVLTDDLAQAYDTNETEYDEHVVTAVKHFQERHALKEDGVLGKHTLQTLNIPVQTKIDKLKLNLERTRWILQNLSDEFIVVNIANFFLYYLKGEEVEYRTRVVVGKIMHETPIFTAKMKYLVYNPTWTVPHSIAVKELLAKAQRDPLYFDKNNLELLDRSYNVVDHTEVDFSQYTKHDFPFTFRQKPGPKNALGQIKFIFPNKHSVYLHDTPAKYIFAKNRRAFSHGCIRVSNPFALAKFILKQQNIYNESKINTIRVSQETKTVMLKEELDVFLMYWTAATDINATAYFYADLYSRDNALLKALHTPLKGQTK